MLTSRDRFSDNLSFTVRVNSILRKDVVDLPTKGESRRGWNQGNVGKMNLLYLLLVTKRPRLSVVEFSQSIRVVRVQK